MVMVHATGVFVVMGGDLRNKAGRPQGFKRSNTEGAVFGSR